VSHIKPSVQARARLADIGDGPAHICAGTGTGLAPATSAPGLGWAGPCHICTGTGLTPTTSAPGPPLHHNCAFYGTFSLTNGSGTAALTAAHGRRRPPPSPKTTALK
jgi:hypothetical protein